MKQLQIVLPKKQLDGQITAYDLDLKTLAPVQVTGVMFSSPGRLVLCADRATRDRLVNTSYQMMQESVPGMLLHIASNVIWSEFDFTAFNQGYHQLKWLRYPYTWQPVTVQANNKEGKLFCMVESRAGNAKHKAEIAITLQVKHGK